MELGKIDKDAFHNDADAVLWEKSMIEQQERGIVFEGETMILLLAIIEDGLIPVHRAIVTAVQGRARMIMTGEDPFGRWGRAVYELMDDGTVRRFTPAPPSDGR